jgi:hypothetical protein
MAVFDSLFLAVLTRDEDNAGTACLFMLTINIDGEDILSNVGTALDVDDGEAGLGFGGNPLGDTPLDLTGLTNSSIRLGLQTWDPQDDNDAWGPQHVLLFGHALPDFVPGRTMAIAIETDLTFWVSTRFPDGRLTMPLRLVSPGDSTTTIRRVLLLVETQSEDVIDAGTDSPIQLEIVAGGILVMKHKIVDTPQPDLEAETTNWYFLDAEIPFSKGDVLSNGGIRLSILGDDAWLPKRVFVFGLDTRTGRPSQVVTLVSEADWIQGWLSTDPKEGAASIDLPIESL